MIQSIQYNKVSIEQEYTLQEYPLQECFYYKIVSITKDIHWTTIYPCGVMALATISFDLPNNLLSQKYDVRASHLPSVPSTFALAVNAIPWILAANAFRAAARCTRITLFAFRLILEFPITLERALHLSSSDCPLDENLL